MEARVDIKKLQLLNDRIVQTIDALNQVRLSVHGLQHSSGIAGVSPFATSASSLGAYGTPSIGAGIGLGAAGLGAGFGAVSPYAMMSAAPYGLSHTSLSPYASPSVAASLAATSPFAWQQALLAQQLGGASIAAGMSPWAGAAASGLSHSTLEEQWIAEIRANDPRRLANTFPFCYSP